MQRRSEDARRAEGAPTERALRMGRLGALGASAVPLLAGKARLHVQGHTRLTKGMAALELDEGTLAEGGRRAEADGALERAQLWPRQR